MESYLKEPERKMRKRADFSPLQEIVKNDYALDCLDIFFAKLYKLKKYFFLLLINFKSSFLFNKSCITFDILNSNAFLGKSVSKRSRAGFETLLFLPLWVDSTPRI